MEGKPSHRSVQIHLATAIVLMFAAGGLLYLNCREREFAEYVNSSQKNSGIERGWPWIFSKDVKAIGFSGYIEVTYDDSKLPSVMGDIGVAVLVLFLSGLLTERLLRRREVRKP